MASSLEDLFSTDTSTEESQPTAPAVSADYPKVQAGSEPTSETSALGSIPLSVSESDLPHHRAADPTATEESES
ncbi:MAG TPA: hypothetical protein VFW71_00510 [Actinomycetota bacterium]|nr:hypothetical protein [Actinomycetota bacterium]